MRTLATLALIATLALSAACGGQQPGPEELAQASSPLTQIQSTCLKPSNDPAAVFPWNASWPLGTQDVYCQNMPNETNRRTWPAGISRCTNGNAGARQVDVWFADNSAPTVYTCARVTLAAAPAHFTLDFEPFLEMGWLAQSLDPARTKQVIGLYVGPGSSVVVESRQTANPLGCTEPVSGCVSFQLPANGTTSWVPVTGFKAGAVNFY